MLRDKDDILPAEEWRTRLEGLIIGADAVIFCLSPTCLNSRETHWELETAERLSKRIIPVVVRPFAEPAPDSVARLNYIFMTEPATVGRDGLQKLRSAIQTDVGWDSLIHAHAPASVSSELSNRPSRRTFTAADKLRILAATDRALETGGVGAVLRCEGVYSSNLCDWRRQRDAGTLGAVTPARRGPKALEATVRMGQCNSLQAR